jgi:hypothetical protein
MVTGHEPGFVHEIPSRIHTPGHHPVYSQWESQVMEYVRSI